MKFFTSLLITFFTVAASATTIDLNLLEYTYGTPANYDSQSYIETSLRFSEAGYVSVERSRVFGRLGEAKKLLKKSSTRLDDSESASLRMIVEELSQAELEERYNRIVCMVVPPLGSTVNDLKVIRTGSEKLRLVDNAKGCYMSYTVQPMDVDLRGRTVELKKELKSLATEILDAAQPITDGEVFMTFNFAQTIKGEDITFGPYHDYTVALMNNGKVRVTQMKSGLNRRAPIFVKEVTEKLPLELEISLRGFADKMKYSEIKERSFLAGLRKALFN